MNKYKSSILGVIGLCITSCSLIISPRKVTPIIGTSNAWSQDGTDTSIPLTLTSPNRATSTKTPEINIITKTLTPTNNFVKLNSLPSGRYLIYSIQKEDTLYYQYIISESGVEMGLLSLGPAIQYISSDQKYIAYLEYNNLILFDIDENRKITVPLEKGVAPNADELSWGPTSEKMAIATDNSIAIINVADGKKIGDIAHILNPQKEAMNMPYSPSWSPDGKWIAYFIMNGQMEHQPSPGPYVSDITCMTDPMGCDKKTKLIVSASDQLLDWTPSSHLVIFDKYDKIRIYDVLTSSLIKEIQLPDDIESAELFSWSNDEEWVAFGGRCGVCILSIKTREVKVLTINGYILDFWYVVP